MSYTMNQFQTPLTEELLNNLHLEIKELLLEFINNVPFILNLISPTREYAKDRPRDNDNKIIVDLCKPHILENMNYFRPTAIHYQKYGTLTSLRPNGNPNSEYGIWVREERRRIWEGYVRESDGEWVTGDMYFYLNYTPIIQSKIRKGTKLADRVIDFPEIWEGVYWRSHYIDLARSGGLYNNWEGGNHGAELASRGKSKSYYMAAKLAKLFVLGENALSCKKTRGIVTASLKEYLTKEGIINKFIAVIDFCAQNTQFPSKRIKNSLLEMNWIMGYVDTDTGTQMGTLNEVIGVSSNDDITKLRGKRGNFIGIEEFGSFSNLLELYNILLPSVEEGDIVFGLLYLLGTAGDSESDFLGALEIMYNPNGYNMYALPNIYDKSTLGKKQFVFFFPGYVNRKGCYNEDGVSDVIAALIQILKNRFKVKYNSSDPTTIVKTIAEIPITPQEAIARTKNNIFPVTELQARLDEIDMNPSEYNDVYIGELKFTKNNQVEYAPKTVTPIREFPHKDNKLEGGLEIFKLPELDKDGKVFSERYIIGNDPFDDDLSETLSLGSIFVLDLWTDTIVAEFTGRPMFADDFFEISRKLCLFYNGRMNYENNKKGLFAYFSKMNSLYLLTDVLDFLKDKDMIKGVPYGNKSKGVNATAVINGYARTLIRNWLLKPVITIEVIDGLEQEVLVPNLKFIRSRALLKELILWNSEGNFDRVSSLGMLMLLRLDKLILYGDNPREKLVSTKDKNYLGDDKFFTDNYDKRMTLYKMRKTDEDIVWNQ